MRDRPLLHAGRESNTLFRPSSETASPVESLRQPLTLLATFAAVVLAAIWWLVATQLRDAHDDAYRDALVAADAWADRYAEQMRRVLQQVDQVSMIVRGEVLAGRVVDRRIDSRNLLTTDTVVRAAVLDGRGWVVAGTDPSTPVDLSGREYFGWHRDNDTAALRASDPVVGTWARRPVVPFTRRISDAAGRFVGVVAVSVEPAVLTGNFVRSLRAGGGGDPFTAQAAVSVVRSDGLIVARESPDGPAVGQAVRVSVPELRRRSAGAESPEMVSPFDGVRRLVRYRDVRGYEVGVAVGLPLEAAMAPYLRVRSAILRGAFAGSVGILGFVVAIGWQMRRLQRARRDAHNEQQFCRRVLDALPFAITVRASQGGQSDVLTFWNAAAARLSRLPASTAIGSNAEEVARQSGLSLLHREHLGARDDRVAECNETWLDRKGRIRHVKAVLSKIPAEDGGPPQLLSIRRDTTDAVNDRQRLQLFQAVVRQAAEGVVITDLEDRVIDANPAFLAMSGYDAEHCVGRKAEECGFEPLTGASRAGLRRRLLGGQASSAEISLRLADGTQRPCRLVMSAVRDERGAVTHFVRLAGDISDLRASQRALERLALFDPLTGLRNRTAFGRDIDLALETVSDAGPALALVFIDLDDFKHVNDLLGHGAGDDLLQVLAQRLAACVHAPSTLYRLGGDEFLVVVRAERVRDESVRIAQCVRQCLTEAVALHGNRFETTCSAGIAVFPEDGRDATELLRNADLAMYHAKQAGKNRFQHFDQSVRAALERRLDIEHGLAQAVERGELALHYQPKVRVAGGELVGFEALLRWHRPGLGDVSPALFVPIAERSDLILRIGHWVIVEACRQQAAWRDQGHAVVPVAVNVSARQLVQPGFVDSVRQALAAHRLPASLLQVEITEESLIDDLALAQGALAELGTLGVAVAIDDFGTGHSSLSRLRHLRVDTLKIDRGFLLAAGQSADGAAIYRAMLQLAASLGLQSVAEGVETCEQMRFVRESGCSQAQGWLVAKPLSPALAARFIHERAAGPGVRPVMLAQAPGRNRRDECAAPEASAPATAGAATPAIATALPTIAFRATPAAPGAAPVQPPPAAAVRPTPVPAGPVAVRAVPRRATPPVRAASPSTAG